MIKAMDFRRDFFPPAVFALKLLQFRQTHDGRNCHSETLRKPRRGLRKVSE
jgi:hypothetical protein